MADNIAVKPSTDATAVNVATDEVSSKHYQINKLALGEDGVATLIPPGVQEPSASVPVVNNQKTGLLTTLTASASSTPVDLATAGYKNLTLHWDVTVLSAGSWQIVVQMYDYDENQDSYYLAETEAITGVGATMLTVPLFGAQKVKISHVRSSGTITSTTKYILWS